MGSPRLRLALLVIAILTVISGAVQMVAPAFVLHVVGGQGTPAALHFFGIVGMFMVLFGALMAKAAKPGEPAYPLVLAGLQKFGASAAVGLGILKGLFGPLAWGVAGFDLLSGLLVLLYLRRSKEP